jgi:hypothetical protein
VWDFREEERRDGRGRSTLYSDRKDVTVVSQDLPIMPNYRVTLSRTITVTCAGLTIEKVSIPAPSSQPYSHFRPA